MIIAHDSIRTTIRFHRQMAMIPAGELFTTFTFSTIDDDAYERDERVLLFLRLVGPERIVGVGDWYRNFMLVDNEPEVSLDPLPRQITEGEALTVTARLDRMADVDVTVRLDVCPEYDPFCAPYLELSPSEATIPAGELVATFTINTIDDDVYGRDEYVYLDLSIVSPERIVGVGEGRRGFRLLDNEPTVSLDYFREQITEGQTLTVGARPGS